MAAVSKVLGAVGKIAGAVAAVAAVIPGGQAIAAVAAAVATVSNIGAQLTAKPPPARGSVTDFLISPNAPAPILLGRTYYGGVLRHRTGYGGKVNDVHNPYRFMAVVYSVAGPVDACESVLLGFEQQVGSGTGLSGATGYYSGFLWADRQLGARPEADALAPQFSGAPNWGSDYKLSGKAAIGWSMKFDKKGNRFASGIDHMGGVWRGVKAWDPRLDSTYPGGSGPCRHLPPDHADYETARATYVYTVNPAIVALQYALGWFKEDPNTGQMKKEAGIVAPLDAVDLASFVAFANVCDANGWTVSGVIFEPPGGQTNLRRILSAGGAIPIYAGGKLTVYYQAPRLALDTITDDDLAGEVDFTPWPAWQDGRNGIIPTYRSEAHDWEMVQSALVSDATLLANDGGEPKVEEVVFELVADKDQAAELAKYLLWERRERGPIEVPVKARLRHYRPGDKLTLSVEASTGIPEMDVVIVRRTFDPIAMRWNFTLREEIDSKHAAVLGSTGTAPPTITRPTNEDRDTAAGGALGFDATISNAIIGSVITASDGAMSSAVDGSTAKVTVPDMTRTYPAPFPAVSVDGADITGLTFNTGYAVYYDDPDLSGGAVTFAATTNFADAVTSEAHPFRHFVGSITTVATDGSPGTATPVPPPGTGGGGLGDWLNPEE